MTKGSPWKLITQFAVPVFLSQVFQQLYNTADALIVGRFLGDEALAAVSASGPLIFLLISFFTGLSMGAGVTISRYFGAGDYGRVSKAIHTDVMLGLLSGIVLTVVGVLLTPTFLRWMGTAPEVLPDAIAYFQYYFFGVLAVVMYNMCKSIMNALGDSKRPLYYLIISSLTNIVLDLLFIGGFGWGVWAAAVATTISQAVSMVLCLIHLMKKGTIYQLKPKELRIDGEMLGQIVRYGLPSGVQNSVIGFANVIVQSNINSFGKVAMAAYGAYSKLEGFAFLPVTSFTMALTTFVGQNLGAGLHDRAKQGSRFGVRLKAGAPSLHMIRVDIQTEVSPIVGTEKQSEELVKSLLSNFEGDPKSLWETEIFGRSLSELVKEGLAGKLMRMPDDVRSKVQQSLAKIINEGNGGMICILL